MPGARAEERPLTRDINESLSPGEVVFPLACGQEETLCQTGRGNGARAVATTGPLTQTADAQVDVYITPGKHTYLGFLGRRSSNVVDLAGCPVLVPSLDAATPERLTR